MPTLAGPSPVPRIGSVLLQSPRQTAPIEHETAPAFQIATFWDRVLR